MGEIFGDRLVYRLLRLGKGLPPDVNRSNLWNRDVAIAADGHRIGAVDVPPDVYCQGVPRSDHVIGSHGCQVFRSESPGAGFEKVVAILLQMKVYRRDDELFTSRDFRSSQHLADGRLGAGEKLLGAGFGRWGGLESLFRFARYFVARGSSNRGRLDRGRGSGRSGRGRGGLSGGGTRIRPFRGFILLLERLDLFRGQILRIETRRNILKQGIGFLGPNRPGVGQKGNQQEKNGKNGEFTLQHKPPKGRKSKHGFKVQGLPGGGCRQPFMFCPGPETSIFFRFWLPSGSQTKFAKVRGLPNPASIAEIFYYIYRIAGRDHEITPQLPVQSQGRLEVFLLDGLVRPAALVVESQARRHPVGQKSSKLSVGVSRRPSCRMAEDLFLVCVSGSIDPVMVPGRRIVVDVTQVRVFEAQAEPLGSIEPGKINASSVSHIGEEPPGFILSAPLAV